MATSGAWNVHQRTNDFSSPSANATAGNALTLHWSRSSRGACVLNQRTASSTAADAASLLAPAYTTTRRFVDSASNAELFSSVRIGRSSRVMPTALTMDGSPGSLATACRSSIDGTAASTAETISVVIMNEV